ncbi:glycogen debranching N-terminal domain-containing protein [Microbacterium oleivorans]|uniref:Glycogen debranching enzyme n=1 Tax=Microbacterium oleivorans TaxID=273677 RepID=A0A031FT92_9MICO|nr:glycogen debranching N-terminal domain-containing protein [Microbacterium oleivorans]EZP26840.1 Glycogen debranching enzyme [Microbacterium oleivorans]
MTEGLQPFLSDAVAVLRAPTQVWSRADGEIGAGAIDGVFHGDTRFVRATRVRYGTDAATHAPEWISRSAGSASDVRFEALLRRLDDRTPDPKIRLTRRRVVVDGRMIEEFTLVSHLEEEVGLVLEVAVTPDATPMQEVKSGARPAAAVERTLAGDAVELTAGAASMRLRAPGGEVTASGDDLVLTWHVTCPPRAAATVSWHVDLDDPSLVVRGTARQVDWALQARGGDPRLNRWLRQALDDLDALRLTLPGSPDEFFAAGAPWFFTLFGRDSLWAARLFLSVDPGMAASTLRVLGRLQGSTADPATAEEPGKIAHELRAGTLTMPGEGISLPPLYYGTVDATPLWVTLLSEAHEAGMPEADVRDLLPAMHDALDWILASANADGFLDYVDETGHGLSNQGWKDSGDSIQWRDGTLADGPIALSEVQGYAYEAVVRAADLLDALDEEGSGRLRTWAAELRTRFRERFWVTTPEGRYPAIALDRDGRAVDTLTSNAGHLLGTGILDPEEERAVADLLTGTSMTSGFGLRTMSTDAGGYWPLSYHGGSVWAHDTAIVARGMARAGLVDHARVLVDGMLNAAEAFAYRVPELHAGDAASDVSVPAPYPAACRPQAWSAAAAVVCHEIVTLNR